MDTSVPPVIHASRKVPVALRDKLKSHLAMMTDLQVIQPITDPTDWVSSLVVVEKPDGSLRVCLDPKDLNRAIKREHYHMPTTEDIMSRMSGAKYFTKMDASNAYWQIEVLTFNTPFGRYKFNRMPFSIHSASEICQQQISEIIEGIEGCANAQDDIIVWGDNIDMLRKRTIETLQAIRRSGLKLNRDKCQIEVREVKFLGHILSFQMV